jgi:hypothetical protein
VSVTIHVRSIVRFVAGVIGAGAVALFLAQAGRVGAAPGDTDSTFVPIANCRLFDTRPGVDNVGPRATPIGAGDANVHTQQVTGTNGNCTIPAGAVGVSMNVTVISPTAQSNLRVFPGDVPTPLASNLNWLAGQAPTPNKVEVKLSPDGKVKIFNFSGSVDVLADVIGYYTNSTLTEISSRLAALEATNTSQQAQIDALTAKLANVTVEQVGGHPTVRFTGVNVQIVDGSGNTECGQAGFEACNGRGNLVVGYSEDTASGGVESRTGSHNLVTGTDNAYTRYAGLLAGKDNSSLAAYATLTGGRGGTVEAPYGSVSGGVNGLVIGESSSISGGDGNVALGERAWMAGGLSNQALGYRSVVVGGEANDATGTRSTVVGGQNNTAGGSYATTSGGVNNVASGSNSSVSGGEGNVASGPTASVGGGSSNTASGDLSVVVGGGSNTASGFGSVAVAGTGNQAVSTHSSVGGGRNNVANTQGGTLSGGDTRSLSTLGGNGWDWAGGGLFQTA